VRMAQTMSVKFASHSTRVQTFYTTKLVPDGKTLGNYDTLLADIAAKKSVVDSALTLAVADAAAFSCTNANPKVEISKFRMDMQKVIVALKGYRTAVRNLVVAVHTLTPKI